MYMFFVPLLNSAIPTPRHPREHSIYSYLGMCYIHLFIHLKGCAFVAWLSLCQQYKVRLTDTIGWMLKVTADWRSDSCWRCTNISAIEGKRSKKVFMKSRANSRKSRQEAKESKPECEKCQGAPAETEGRLFCFFYWSCLLLMSGAWQRNLIGWGACCCKGRLEVKTTKQ